MNKNTKMIVISKEVNNRYVYYIYFTDENIDFYDSNFKIEQNILNKFKNKKYIKNNSDILKVYFYATYYNFEEYYIYKITDNYNEWICCTFPSKLYKEALIKNGNWINYYNKYFN